MISIEEIKEKQEEINKMIEEFEKKNFKWDKNWKPKEDEEYYFIDTDKTIRNYENDNDELDENIIKYIRIFQTKELAEKWLEIDTYLREKSFEPDWRDFRKTKYRFMFDYEDDEFCFIGDYYSDFFSPFYFETEEIKKEIFKKYTTEELKFYFNIGE